MTWLAIILYFKKTWVWCKHHWKIVAIGAWTLFVWAISRKNVAAYKKVLDSTIDNYKKEINVLENTHNAEITKRNEALQKHNEALVVLENNYKESLDMLTVEKRARYLELAMEYDNNPEAINRLLEEEFGFKYVK